MAFGHDENIGFNEFLHTPDWVCVKKKLRAGSV
jgi:hypothetical protein